MKKYFRIILLLGILLILFAAGSNLWVMISTHQELAYSVEEVKPAKVALVLGTSKSLTNGHQNPYFKGRVRKAAELFHAGKVDHLLLSGDNHSRYYNEPMDMRKALLKLGVPESAITLDYAGFRTLDSIVRSKKIFGQDEMIIVTQKFHAFRALFISKFYGLKAQAFVAENGRETDSFSMEVREVFARPKAILDLYVLNKTPRYLGKKEQLGLLQ